jgi:hypothetical protein
MKAGRAQGRSVSRARPDAPGGMLERTKENSKVIRASMQRWRIHNKYGLSIGRGLSNAELIDKVAGETGASKDHIRRSLKKDD